LGFSVPKIAQRVRSKNAVKMIEVLSFGKQQDGSAKLERLLVIVACTNDV
jgi:hypothetical protein